MKWTTIACIDRLQEAYILKSILEEEGIPVFLKDEMTARSYMNPMGTIDLQVPDTDAKRAYDLLVEGGHIS